MHNNFTENIFKLSMYAYAGGKLQVQSIIFNTLQSAIDHGFKSVCYIFKIYDSEGNLVHYAYQDNDPHGPVEHWNTYA